MMVTMSNEYTTQTVHEGQSRCATYHKRSGETWHTDIPVSLGGLGLYATPGALLASAAASCMMSMISFFAYRKNVDTVGMKIESRAEEEDGKISCLHLRVTMPLEGTHPLRKMLEDVSSGCPVRKALNPEIEIDVEWIWL